MGADQSVEGGEETHHRDAGGFQDSDTDDHHHHHHHKTSLSSHDSSAFEDADDDDDDGASVKHFEKRPSVTSGDADEDEDDGSTLIGGEKKESRPVAQSARKSCSERVMQDTCRGGALGAVIGGFMGAHESFSAGERGRVLMGHAGRYALQNTFSFATFLGSFVGTKCYVAQFRKSPEDMFCTFTAGFVAGGVGAFPTRNPRTMLISAAIAAVVMSGLEVAQTFRR
eukprot:gnl/Spiro4/17371_TR9252_c0_g1_i1.p1 gnl/Spiro4/17371_TR9252_c0_g1~~gnl/Spiro4/17371_TR9252_c0_g1_i1.p1  ORF type:complete len:226 (+),score=34.23 gnl/Spiro4/17371_TR9252_c0_g1_i1:98-775(+)